MNWNTVIWSVVAFVSAYAGVMAIGPAGVYFSWPAVVAGCTTLSAYHIGKGQAKGGVVNAVSKAL